VGKIKRSTEKERGKRIGREWYLRGKGIGRE
jgi:hypothetical protein